MKNIILLIFIMVFLYYLPEIIYKFILDLFFIKRTFTGDGYNLKYNSNWKKIKTIYTIQNINVFFLLLIVVI